MSSKHGTQGPRGISDDSRGVIGLGEAAPCASACAQDAFASIVRIESGTLRLARPDGASSAFGGGTMLLCFSAQPLQAKADVHWEGASISYVRPSTSWIAQVLGVQPVAVMRSVEPLRHGLAPFLGSQFDMLKRHGSTLAAQDLGHVVDSIFQTTEVLMKTLLMPAPAPAPAGSPAPVSDRLRAVQRFIGRNLHRAELSVADIASGTNMSRSNLYRLFDAQFNSVHGTLREERLQRGWSYLRREDSGELSIASIAHACGFSDQAVFSKLFRQRFDMTPRQARAQEPPSSERPKSGDQ